MCVIVITGLFAFSSQWQLPKSVCFFYIGKMWRNDQSQKLMSLRLFHLGGKADRELRCLWSWIRLYFPYTTLCYPKLGSNQTITRLCLYWKSQSPVACSLAQAPHSPHLSHGLCTVAHLWRAFLLLHPDQLVSNSLYHPGSLKQSSALSLLMESPLISKAFYLPCFRRIGMLSLPLPMMHKELDLALSTKLKW